MGPHACPTYILHAVESMHVVNDCVWVVHRPLRAALEPQGHIPLTGHTQVAPKAYLAVASSPD